MKQYLNSDQTAKLIGLGFEKPKSIEAYRDWHYVPFVEQQLVYSIGELIEMLPKTIEVDIWWGREKGKAGTWGLRIDTNGVDYMWTIVVGAGEELIDALYDMVVQLKEEGVI